MYDSFQALSHEAGHHILPNNSCESYDDRICD
jgi:hypothetical protein